MSADPFDAPPPRGNGGRPVSDVERDQWDRPKLPDVPSPDVTAAPDMSTKAGRTTVSTLMKVLEDPYGLTVWKMGMAVKGIAMNEGLYAQACSLDPADENEKKQLYRVAQEALDSVPESSRGRNNGSALHKYIDRIHTGQDPGKIPEHLQKDVAAYVAGFKQYGFSIVTGYTEKMVIVPGLTACGTAGTFDALIWHPDWKLPRVADLKSTQDLRKGMGVTIQLGAYSRGAAIWNPITMRFEPMPEVDQEWGVALGLPVGQGRFEPQNVPLNEGWRLARKAADIHADRKRQWITPMQPPRLAGLSWEDQIATATSRADLSRIRAAAIAVDAWSPALKDLGLIRLAELENSVPVGA